MKAPKELDIEIMRHTKPELTAGALVYVARSIVASDVDIPIHIYLPLDVMGIEVEEE